MSYSPEPPNRHGAPARTGVLLVNLGTPEAPTRAALRRYLKEFLWDPRLVEAPCALWWLVLHGFILNTRPAKSAEKYAKIWTPEGSPLRVHTEKQAKWLRDWLGQAGIGHILVDWAMRYGQPSVAAVLERLQAQGCGRILVVPLYPQYAASTTASVMDQVANWMRRTRNLPELRWTRGFHDDPGYIAALAASVQAHWAKHGYPDKLLMSFHGLPRTSLERGDPYHCECQKTAQLLAEALGLEAGRFIVTFQSRFGRGRWLEPYTQVTLEELAQAGTKRVDVLCPGFVADCLETLEEIGLECKATFLQAGGTEFHLIDCLNERAEWIEALAKLVRRHLGHWLELSPDADELTPSVLPAWQTGAQD